MNAIAPRRKGWCPGALRPMETGDGLLARVRASGGRLSLDQAAAIAERAARVRQRRDRALGARQPANARRQRADSAATCKRGFAPSACSTRTPRSSALRNIVASPLSDIDPAAALRPRARPSRRSRARLAEDSSLCVPAGEIRLRHRRARPPAARRRRRGRPLRGRARRAASRRSPSFLAAMTRLAAAAPRWPKSARRRGAARARLSCARPRARQAARRMRALVARVGRGVGIRRRGPRGGLSPSLARAARIVAPGSRRRTCSARRSVRRRGGAVWRASTRAGSQR